MHKGEGKETRIAREGRPRHGQVKKERVRKKIIRYPFGFVDILGLNGHDGPKSQKGMDQKITTGCLSCSLCCSTCMAMTLGILYTPSLMCDAFCFEYYTNWELDSYLKQMSVFRLFNFGFIFPFHPVLIVGDFSLI